MSHYGEIFTRAAASSSSSSSLSSSFSLSSQQNKLQQKFDKRFYWFIENNDWMQALRWLQQTLGGNVQSFHRYSHYRRQQQGSSSRAKRNNNNNNANGILSPNHIQDLLIKCPSAISSQQLLEYLRSQCTSDDIPNSPELYVTLAQSFCRSRNFYQPQQQQQEQQNQRQALELAIEGNARWRFSPKIKNEIGIEILKQCATTTTLPQQNNSWQLACETMRHLISLPTTTTTTSSSSTMSNNNKNDNNSILKESQQQEQKELIKKLLSECAYRSGNVDVVADRILKKNRNMTKQNQQQQQEEEDYNNDNSSYELNLIWKACRDAAYSATNNNSNSVVDEETKEKSISLFEEAINLTGNNINNNEKFPTIPIIAFQAVHAVVNMLGADNNENWKLILKVANSWTSKFQVVDDILSNLVFASFPKPKCFSSNGNGNGNSNSDTVAVTSVTSQKVAIQLFEKWLFEMDSYSPPALTSALMVGFWIDEATTNLRTTKDTSSAKVANADDSEEEKTEFFERCIGMVSRFSSCSQHQQLTLSPGSILHLEKAKKVLFKYFSSSSQPQQQEKQQQKERIEKLQFPSPKSKRLEDFTRLANYRMQRWNLRRTKRENTNNNNILVDNNNKKEQHESSSLKKMFDKTSVTPSRPSRNDYFPLAQNSFLQVSSEATKRYEEQLENAMKIARYQGQHSFDDEGVATSSDGASANNNRNNESNILKAPMSESGDKNSNKSKQKDAYSHNNNLPTSAFADPRPAPYGHNDRASGWEHYKMGGNVIYPKGSKIASLQSPKVRRMPSLHAFQKSWKSSTGRGMLKRVSKSYKFGKSI